MNYLIPRAFWSNCWRSFETLRGARAGEEGGHEKNAEARLPHNHNHATRSWRAHEAALLLVRSKTKNASADSLRKKAAVIQNLSATRKIFSQLAMEMGFWKFLIPLLATSTTLMIRDTTNPYSTVVRLILCSSLSFQKSSKKSVSNCMSKNDATESWAVRIPCFRASRQFLRLRRVDRSRKTTAVSKWESFRTNRYNTERYFWQNYATHQAVCYYWL